MVTQGVRLAEMIKDIGVAMVTTSGPDGQERNRPLAALPVAGLPGGPLPLAALPVEWGEDLWFVTRRGSETAVEVQQAPHIRLCFASPTDQRFVSVLGRATLVSNPDQDGTRGQRRGLDRFAEQLPVAGGAPSKQGAPPDALGETGLLERLAELDLALLRVRIDQAEFWDAPTRRMVQILGAGSN